MYGLPSSSLIINYKLISYSKDESIFSFVNMPTQRAINPNSEVSQHSDDLVDAVKRDHRHLDDEAVQMEMQ